MVIAATNFATQGIEREAEVMAVEVVSDVVMANTRPEKRRKVLETTTGEGTMEGKVTMGVKVTMEGKVTMGVEVTMYIEATMVEDTVAPSESMIHPETMVCEVGRMSAAAMMEVRKAVP